MPVMKRHESHGRGPLRDERREIQDAGLTVLWYLVTVGTGEADAARRTDGSVQRRRLDP